MASSLPLWSQSEQVLMLWLSKLMALKLWSLQQLVRSLLLFSRPQPLLSFLQQEQAVRIPSSFSIETQRNWPQRL